MLWRWLQLVRQQFCSRKANNTPRRPLRLESLEERLHPAANLDGNVLVVTGDDGGVPRADTIELRSAGGVLDVIVNDQVQFSEPEVGRLVRVFAGKENDRILVNRGHDNELFGGSGDDVIQAGPGDDVVDGRGRDAPQDAVDGSAGVDVYQAAADKTFIVSDVVVSGQGTDPIRNIALVELTLIGPSGRTVSASERTGRLKVTGGPGTDVLIGGSGSDELHGMGGSDVIQGNAGDDLLDGGDGLEQLDGGPGNDTIDGGADGAAIVKGGDGNDRIVGGGAILDGGAGDDHITCSDDGDSADGGEGHDTIIGGAGGDTLRGGAGNDILVGAAGIDILKGEDGNDDLNGGDGIDILDGGLGDDHLDGGPGLTLTDEYRVSADTDFIVTDTQVIGQGTDTLVNIAFVKLRLSDQEPPPNGMAALHVAPVSAALETAPGRVVNALGRTLKLEVEGSAGNDKMYGGSGQDIFKGMGGNDLLQGNGGDDTLVGGAGDDTLEGGPGNDTLQDTVGNNVLDGGPGVDDMNGLKEAATTSPTTPANPTTQTTPSSPAPQQPVNNNPVVPSIRVRNVRALERNGRVLSYAIFTVTLSARSTRTISVSFTTINGKARAGSDYRARFGIIRFRPGQIRKTITIAILGDNRAEANEVFFIRLSRAMRATLGTKQATATILDDDRLRPRR